MKHFTRAALAAFCISIQIFSLQAQNTNAQGDAAKATTSEVAPVTATNAPENTLTFADTAQSDTAKANTNNFVDTLFAFVRMILVLAIVIALIYFTFSFMKKISKGKAEKETQVIKVLASKSIAGTRALHVVAVGEKVFFLGSAEGSVSLLSTIDDKELCDALLLEADTLNALNSQSGKNPDFQSILLNLLGSKNKKSETKGLDFLKNQHDRLGKL